MQISKGALANVLANALADYECSEDSDDVTGSTVVERSAARLFGGSVNAEALCNAQK